MLCLILNGYWRMTKESLVISYILPASSWLFFGCATHPDHSVYSAHRGSFTDHPDTPKNGCLQATRIILCI